MRAENLLRLPSLVEHLHHLGPRAVGELLMALADRHGPAFETDLMAHLDRYRLLDPEAVAFVGGRHFPPPPLREVLK